MHEKGNCIISQSNNKVIILKAITVHFLCSLKMQRLSGPHLNTNVSTLFPSLQYYNCAILHLQKKSLYPRKTAKYLIRIMFLVRNMHAETGLDCKTDLCLACLY